jgi:hypothetical protein
MNYAKQRQMTEVTVYDYPSGLGGSHTVELLDNNKAVIHWGRVTFTGWQSHGDFDGQIISIDPAKLKNERRMTIQEKT